MKWLVNNSKLVIIIVFVLICGVVMQLSRSEIVLKAVQNEQVSEAPNITPTVQNNGKYEVMDAPDYCILYNADSHVLKDNTAKTLEYMQKTYRPYDVLLEPIDYDNCSTVLLTTNSLKDLGTIDQIEGYVKNGGNLFLMSVVNLDSHFQILYRQMGINDYFDYIETTGIDMTTNVLIGAAGKTFNEGELNDSSIGLTLNHGVKPLMENVNGIPLLWKTAYGEGNFMMFNATFLAEKVSRGTITGALSLLEDQYIYPIFNTKTFYIDDFPAPIAQGRNETIYKEYKQDLSSFYQNIWWSDMLKAASKFNIVYTGVLIESYNDSVTPPFNNNVDSDLSYLISYGRELIKGGGEIGFHGYNHQSLTLDETVSKSFGYTAWKSTEDMQAALEELLDYTSRAFPSYKITSYVPPSNVLSPEGRQVLADTLDDLVVIASLYNGDATNRSYIQEFEVAEDKIVEMPRISSGYFNKAADVWSMANAATGLGVFSHFIHPDDVISSDRSRGGWADMYDEFEELMEDIDTSYPWLRAMTATDAALDLANTLHTEVQFDESDKEVKGTIEHFKQDQYFILRSTKKIGNTEDCTVTKIDDNTYLVTAHKADFTIKFKG